MPSGLFYLKSLYQYISSNRGVWLVFIITKFCRHACNECNECKQSRPWSDAAFLGVWSRSTLFVSVPFIYIYFQEWQLSNFLSPFSEEDWRTGKLEAINVNSIFTNLLSILKYCRMYWHNCNTKVLVRLGLLGLLDVHSSKTPSLMILRFCVMYKALQTHLDTFSLCSSSS